VDERADPRRHINRISIDKVDYPMLPQRVKRDTAITGAKEQSGESASLPSLQLSRNDEVLQELPVDVPRLLIGREEDNDVAIPSRFVSRYHILLIRHGGATILIDLKSTNGTFVNSKRVYNHVLTDGDVITVDLHSKFVQYSIRYCDPSKTRNRRLGDIAGANTAVRKALKDIRNPPGNRDTDLLPALSENTPTEMGFIDDR